MKILSSDMLMASTHAASSRLETQESLRAWTGRQRPDFEGRTAAAAPPSAAPAPSSIVQISAAAGVAPTEAGQAIADVGDEVENDPRVQLIKSLIEILTGKKIHVFHAADLQQAPPAAVPAASPAPADPAKPAAPAGWGLEYDYHASYSETETTTFQASGVITTADHRQISFNLSFELQRSYQEELNVSIRRGDARKVDPLLLNFSGDSAQLSSQKFAFDLNADGIKENISFVQGAGFLVLDKNGDGKVNDGKEMFGPGTGNGFAELRTYDSDGNNWIDESDAIYQQLKIWTKDSAGQDHLSSLQQAKVGALLLGSASTPFALNNAQNQTQGQLRSSGVWLNDEGQTHSLQQIDLAV
ncbi:MAG: VCBS repeat-containing protein [Burkholderiales bacterium]|nr:VCBS repeat-containing protein [Burkholderiales bacterium]